MKHQLSPFLFKQEIYIDEPWKMLIVCMMLNQTSYKQVDNVRIKFFEKFPDAETLLKSSDDEIIDIIRPLGFYNRRCKIFKKFSEAWIKNEWKHIEELPGIGRYASDSWKIFQEGNTNIKVYNKGRN